MSRDSRPLPASPLPGGDVVPCPEAMRGDARRALAERLLRVADDIGGCARAAREIGDRSLSCAWLDELHRMVAAAAEDVRGGR